MNELWFAAVLAAVLLGVFAALVIRLQARRGVPGEDPAWLEGFSLARYRPMERLLSENDFRFLKAQPGYRTAIGRRLRRERRRIFRGYLGDLRHDFLRLHALAREAVVSAATTSAEDRAGLLMRLIRQRLAFTAAVWAVEGRLALYACGLDGVNVKGLVRAVELMHGEIRRLQSA